MNQDEIFEIRDGRANKAPDFGIYVGKEDVALIVEPSSDYLQNTSRTALVQKDGSELPWDRWADEFREQMPSEIKKFIEEKLASMTQESDAANIKDRLKSISHLFKLSRFKKDESGGLNADPESDVKNKSGASSEVNSNLKGGTRS